MDESVQKHLTPALDEAGKQLLAAAAMIEERGWIQYAAKRAAGFCALGALDEVAGGGEFSRNMDAWSRLEAAVGGNVATWNDRRGRTKDEVVSTMRRVALGG